MNPPGRATGGRVRARMGLYALLVPALALLLFGFLIPLLLLVPKSLNDPSLGLTAYSRLFGRSVYLGVVRKTAMIALKSTIIIIAFGYPMSLWVSRLRSRARMAALIVIVLPFWVSILVRTYSWIVILGREGIVNSVVTGLSLTDEPISFLYRETSVLIGTANILAPFFILPMVAAMSAIDPKLSSAARSLGASRFQAFWRVFFPLTLPALVTGAFLVFILTFGFYVTPSVLGGGRVQMLATLLDYLVNTSPDWPLAAALSLFLLILTLVVAGISRIVTSRSATRRSG